MMPPSNTATPSAWARFAKMPFFLPVMASLLYCTFSASMVLVNKSILSLFEWRHKTALLLFQSVMSLMLVVAAKHAGYAKFQFEPFNTQTALKWLPVNVAFVAMLSTSTFATHMLTVPTFTILKNLGNILTALGDRYLFGKRITNGVAASFGLLIAGSLFAGANDMSFSARGYSVMLLNCACTASYVLYMKVAMGRTGLSEAGMSFYNNLLSIPLCLVTMVFTGENPVTVLADPLLGSPGFVVLLVVSGCCGFFLGLSAFFCVKVTSPTTFAVVGSLNKIPIAIIGIWLFQSPIGGWRGAVSIAGGLGAGVVYAYAKSQAAAAAAGNAAGGGAGAGAGKTRGGGYTELAQRSGAAGTRSPRRRGSDLSTSDSSA